MAEVGIIEGEKLLIKIGNGASPEVFAHPCLINTSRGVSFKSNMTETEVADCTTPGNPAKIARKVKSIDFEISGAGKVDKTSVWDFIDWWQSATPKNITVEQTGTGATGGWTGEGPAILSAFAVTGDRGDYQDCTLTIVPSDSFVWTEAS